MKAMRGLRKAASGDHGQTIIEFAVTIPVVLLIFFGLIDFSRAAYTAAVVQWAAQEGARAGTIDPDSVTEAAQGRLAGLQAEQAAVLPTFGADTVTVQVSYPFEFVTPMIAQIAGDGMTMQGTASMMIQPAMRGVGP